jgi:hypothetical protein
MVGGNADPNLDLRRHVHVRPVFFVEIQCAVSWLGHRRDGRPIRLVDQICLRLPASNPSLRIGGAMHAVVVRVTINDFEAAQKILREEVVPRASGAPGFVAGYWTRAEDGTNGLSMVLMDSEESARAAVEMIRAQASQREDVTLNDIEVREVVAHAPSGP